MLKEPSTRVARKSRTAVTATAAVSTQALANAKAGCAWRSEPQPGRELYLAVRAGLMLKGFTINAYCREQRIERQWAYQALMGKSNGPKAQALRRRLVEAAELAA